MILGSLVLVPGCPIQAYPATAHPALATLGGSLRRARRLGGSRSLRAAILVAILVATSVAILLATSVAILLATSVAILLVTFFAVPVAIPFATSVAILLASRRQLCSWRMLGLCGLSEVRCSLPVP